MWSLQTATQQARGYPMWCRHVPYRMLQEIAVAVRNPLRAQNFHAIFCSWSRDAWDTKEHTQVLSIQILGQKVVDI